MIKRAFKILAFVFLIVISTKLFASEPTVSTVDGRQYYCVFDTAPNVRIKISPDREDTVYFNDGESKIEKFVIEWYLSGGGAGERNEKELEGTIDEVTTGIHFNLSDMLGEECIPEKRFTVSLQTYVKDETRPNNNQFEITFVKAPETDFIFDKVAVCSEVPTLLDGMPSCPPGHIDNYTWYITDSSGVDTIGQATGPTYEVSFLEPGTYPVTLITENECGLDTLVQEIEVVENPFHNVVVSTELEDGVNNYCLNNKNEAVIMIDASKTEIKDDGITNPFSWTVIGDEEGYEIKRAGHDGKRNFEFTLPGDYEIRLSISMECSYVYRDTFLIRIHEKEVIDFQLPKTACFEYEFQKPSNHPAGTEYFVDGILVENFPHMIGIGEHTIEAVYDDGLCDPVKKKVKIQVQDPNELFNPLLPQELSFCLYDEKLILPLTNEFSEIELTPDISINEDGEYIFAPKDTGYYYLVEFLGEGLCRFDTTLTVYVSDVENLLTDLSFCASDDLIPIPDYLLDGTLEVVDCGDCIVGSSFDFRNSNEEHYTLRYTVQNNHGCVRTEEASLLVTRPVAKFEVEGLPCIDNIQIGYKKTAGVTYQWSVNGSEPSLHFEELRQYITSFSTNTITQYVIVGKCMDSLTKTFNVIEPPGERASFILDDKVCAPFTLNPQIEAEFSPGFDYTWIVNFKDVDRRFDSYSIPDGQLFTIDEGQKENLEVTYIVENVCGIDSNVANLDVINKPIAELGVAFSNEACDSLPATLVNRSIGDIESSIWRFDGQQVKTEEPFIEYLFVAQDTTTYFPISLTVSNECGEDVAHDTLVVFIPRMDAFFSANKYEICPNEGVFFQELSTPKPISVRWNFGDGSTSTEFNPMHIFDGEKDSYTVELFATTGCGWDTVTKVIQIKPHPNVDFEVPEIICSRDTTARVLSHTITHDQSFTWYIGDSIPNSQELNPFLIFAEGGLQDVTLRVQELMSGCIGEKTKTIDVKERPIAAFTVPEMHCLDEELIVYNQSQHSTHTTWYMQGEEISQVFSPKLNFENKHLGYQNLTLIAENEDYCMDSLSQRFLINHCGYYVPNTFTPNQDGENDFFTIYSQAITKIHYLQIYNRWGLLVFEKKNFLPNLEHEGWDGEYAKRNKSHALGPEVFIYQAQVEYEDGATEVIRGDITVIR